MQISFLKNLHELSLQHHKEEVRAALRMWIDKCGLSLKNFQDMPSRQNLIDLIGIWNRGIIYYDSIVLNDGPGGKGSRSQKPKDPANTSAHGKKQAVG